MTEEQSFIPNLTQTENKTLKWLQPELELILQRIRSTETNMLLYYNRIEELKSQLEILHKNKKIENVNILQLKELCDLKKTEKLAKEKIITALEEELKLLKNDILSLKNGNRNKVNLKALTEELNVFSQYLGLKVIKVKGGWLQFVFTQIDDKNPESFYLFSLKVDSSKKYIVADCQPEIKDIDNLVEKLNSSNNLNAFVHAVRRRFISMAKKRIERQ